jgi:hypothetical protein
VRPFVFSYTFQGDPRPCIRTIFGATPQDMNRLLCSLLLSANLAAGKDFIWLEGESATEKDVAAHPWWYDQVKKDVLSGGEWLHHFSDKKPGSASFTFEVKTAGKYVFWLRANPLASELRWSVDEAGEQLVDFTETRGHQNIAADEKPDLRFLAWVRVGELALREGKHTLKLRFTSKNQHHGGLDCLCLTQVPFIPNGVLKPDAMQAASGPDSWFPLLADEDSFSSESVIDMTALTEAPAGKHGRILADGAALKYEKRPGVVKLWGVGANQEQGRMSVAQNQQRVRYLKKFGINAVRQHPLFDEITDGNGGIDPKKLEAYDRWFADLKQAGIYSHWSIFYHFPIAEAGDYPAELFAELEPMGKGGLRDTYGLICMAPELWARRTQVAQTLLKHKNPFTGLTYAEDPALVAVELQNEDSIFFWNPLGELSKPDGKKWPRHAQKLRQKFAAWAKKQYGDDAALQAAWGDLKGESCARELGIMGPWELDSNGIRGRYAGQTKRAGDQLRFLSEMQRELYRTAIQALRGTGYTGMVITTNWLGGSQLTDQANIYTDELGDMVDRHNYAGGGAGGHAIGMGQIYADSHLKAPGSHLFSIGLKQVENKPFSMTEWTMCPPNQWKLEAAPLFAFYGMGLQGWDASYHFIQSGTRLGDGWPDLRSYASDTPHYLGQFPALAFALHKGHISESKPVAARRTDPTQLFSGAPAWRQDYYDGQSHIQDPAGTPSEIFGIGKVTVGFGGQPSENADLTPFWKKGQKQLQSATGELFWDYGQERILVKTPKTQAIIGKGSDSVIPLPGARVELKTKFVSLIFTPLDDQPLAQSQRILITALARDKQSGAEYSPDGTQLLKTGTAPLLLEPVVARIHLTGPKPKQIRPLDHYGVPKSTAITPSQDGAFSIDGRHQAYYYEIRR